VGKIVVGLDRQPFKLAQRNGWRFIRLRKKEDPGVAAVNRGRLPRDSVTRVA
jgi:hypothetical protein